MIFRTSPSITGGGFSAKVICYRSDELPRKNFLHAHEYLKFSNIFFNYILLFSYIQL